SPAAAPEVAAPLYQHVVHKLQKTNGIGCVKNGMFGEHMQVELVNDGPVTIMLERAPLPPHQQC
ncbi:MAG: D-aminoacyl-tRNA deacylase, partial [Planctomycetota bacterium]|nr:D-aminoacyl-tRNA deacylase [Planctomycetota bacterium]